MTENDKRFEWQEFLGAWLQDPFSTNTAFLKMNMERAIRSVFRMIVGGAVGALVSAFTGAAIGLAIWGSGRGFATDWRDWPIAGAIFKLVVGSIGGAITGAILSAAKRWIGGRGMPALSGVAIFIGSIPGIMLGFFLFFNSKGLAEALIFGMLGGIGGAIGGLIARQLWN